MTFLFLAFAGRSWGQSFFPTEIELDSFHQSFRHVDIDKLDVSCLLKDAGRRHPGLSAEDASQLISRNVSYIIFHRLNRDRLYIAPDGQYIVDQAAEIYDALSKIEGLIAEGRVISRSDKDQSRKLVILNEMKKTAKSLRRKFRQYFIELSVAEYEFQVRLKGDPSQAMMDYLDECEKVNAHLEFTLDRFFFNPTPGVVTVDDYSSYSVALLSRSLEVLADSFEKRLDRSIN